MADKKPIRTVFNADNVATGLAEFQTGETVGLDHGGTGVALSIGTAGQVIKVNGAGNALEFGAVEAIINIDTATDLTARTLVSADQFMVSDDGTEGRATLSQIDAAIKDVTTTLTNKTLAAGSNTITGLTNTNLSGSASISNANLANSKITIRDDSSTTDDINLGETLIVAGGSGITTTVTGNTLTIATDGGVVTETSTDTLTNKSISGSTNTLSNIANSSLTNSSINFGGVTVALGASDTTPALDLSDATDYPTSSLIGTITNAQLDGSIAAGKLAGSIGNDKLSNPGFTILDDSSTSNTVSLGDTLRFAGGTGISSTVSGDTVTFAIDGGVVTETSTDTLTNKSISGSTNTLSNIGNSSLSNSSVNFGGVTVALGASDTTPALDLTDATNYPTSSLTGTITNAQLTGSIVNAKLSNSAVTVGSTPITLGATATTLAGITDITAGSINIAGNVIKSVDSTVVEIGDGDGLSVAGNLTVSGNFTVSGDTTTLSSTNTVITDKLYELANGTTGTPTGDAGIVIERGDQSNAFIGYDESEDKFKVGVGTFTGASTGNLTITTGTLLANIEGNVSGALTGNADTATALASAVNIAGQSFDGSGAITIASTDLSNTTAITLNTAVQTLTNKTLTSPTITGAGAIAGTFTGNITGDVTGNADTATALASAVNIAGQAFDGSSAINIASTDLSNTTAITLLTSTQTLTNKTLTSPKINEDVAVTATATELNYTDGVTSAIQTQLDAKASPAFAIAQAVALG